MFHRAEVKENELKYALNHHLASERLKYFLSVFQHFPNWVIFNGPSPLWQKSIVVIKQLSARHDLCRSHNNGLLDTWLPRQRKISALFVVTTGQHCYLPKHKAHVWLQGRITNEIKESLLHSLHLTGYIILVF